MVFDVADDDGDDDDGDDDGDGDDDDDDDAAEGFPQRFAWVSGVGFA